MAREAILDEYETGTGSDTDNGDDEESRVLKALIGRRMLRRRRVRRAILAQLLRERGEGGADEGYEDEDGEDDEGRAVKALIASRILRRPPLRPMLPAPPLPAPGAHRPAHA